MICNYANIYDYCCNKYSYAYASFITNNNYVVANTGYDGSVYRTDKTTNEIVLLQPNSSLQIKTCDLNDESPELNAWECYLWYKNNNCGPVSDPPLEDYQLAQIDLINSNYDSALDNGLLITISNFATDISLSVNGAYSNTTISETTNFSIVLPAKKDDVINFSNILSLATLLNANDDSSPLPPLIDYYNNAHFLNYYNLTNILSNYFNKLKSYKIIKDNLINNVLNSSTISDIQKQTFAPSYTSTLTSDKNTNLSSKNSTIVKFSSLSCEEKEKLCDPPCDPTNCESCINGQCVGSCPECEVNNDCTYYYCTDAGTVATCDECPAGYTCGGDPEALGCTKDFEVPSLSLTCEEQLPSPRASYSGPFTRTGTCVDQQCEYT
jgi:hypothetical protein